MGVNLILACHEHKVHSYSMRGEEGADVQWWFRHHGQCFRAKRIEVFRDCDEYPDDTQGYEHAWEHEMRPALLGRETPGPRHPND